MVERFPLPVIFLTSQITVFKMSSSVLEEKLKNKWLDEEIVG